MKIPTTTYHRVSITSLISLTLFILSGTAFALDVNITQDISYATINHKGKTVRIQRTPRRDGLRGT